MKQKNKNHKVFGWVLAGGFTVLVAVLALLFSAPKEENTILKELREKNGYIRSVGADEYAFFEKLVSRDSTSGMTETELKEQTIERINRVNAMFMLANRMELCRPYSFESFQLDMENENSQRKLKKENGEVFYGPVEFSLTTYYDYMSSNIKLDLVQFITSHADSEVQDGAKAYFEEHKENYRMIESVDYLLTVNGREEEETALYEDFSILEKTDGELFEFLYDGSEGEVLESVYQGSSRKIEILSVKYEELTYKNNAERVMRDYITNVYLENWLQELETVYPVEINI